ncbi:MAG TPA: WYL domain-containing protein [Bryobacteraceae bacterium]|nr:WYL domain-containing protein [Bryobacteraceae bacterium]
MLETSARLLRLLSLFQGRRYWSGAELAARLEVTPRTLRRDVDKLRSLGYPVHSATGAEGGYQMGAGTTMPPLLLDDEEAVAVSLGLRLAAGGNVEGVEEASIRALAKIEQILPARIGRRVAAMQSAIVTPGRAESAVDARMLSILAGACRDLESLRFRYRDFGGAVSARSVEPHRLVHTGRRWYLVAWDTGRADWRTFRVDRITEKIVAGARFEPRDPPAKDLAAYVAKGAWTSPRCRAKVKLLVAAEEAARHLPPDLLSSPNGMIEAIDERSCWFNAGAPSYESLATHLVFLRMDFELSEPAELVEHVGRLAERYRRAITSI